jgi:hypothetical protein
MSILLGPDNLEADAVVPQCLDNQYVSDEMFAYMLQHGASYDDPVVSMKREQSVKTEFIRSLVYSSQVIVQRAFLRNNEFLYKNYLPHDRQNVAAFASLLRERAIVPFLFTESFLTDNLEFDFREEGDRALESLLKEVGDDLACVRLAVNDETNKQLTRGMTREFSRRTGELQYFQEPERLAMAAELFPQANPLLAAEDREIFRRSLKQLARYAFEKADELEEENRFLSRNQVYTDNFIIPGGNVALGNFKRPSQDNPFILELKKYVDLIYNTNLPDSLDRYTFTPIGLPSRMALQDPTNQNFKHERLQAMLSDKDMLTSIRQLFMARTQKAMSLPLLSELSMADVVEVRSFPQWQNFKETQTNILKKPLECLNLLDQFQGDFNNFQYTLSEWFNRKYEQKNTEEKYCSYVSLGLSIGGKLIVVGADLMPLGGLAADFVMDKMTENIPKKVKGYAAKLIISVYDVGKRKLDKDRSYSIELMQTNAELTREDVIDLLRSISTKPGDGLPYITEQIADQGID